MSNQHSTAKWFLGWTLSNRWVFLVTALMVLTSCAHYPINSKIERIEPLKALRKGLISPDRSDELYMVLAFSGGGTRAAALSYGILEALSKVKVPHSSRKEESHRLLDEVDLITSVSGGSFTAAYYGLYGDRIFRDYKERFLTRNVERSLIVNILRPYNYIRTMSTTFGRSDIASEYYDRILFDEKTLGDIYSRKGPVIAIQATDITNGLNFGFTPYFFSMICGDFDSFPISRAVAASAAFPGPFTPIVLRNYAGTCSFKEEPWIVRALAEKNTANRAYGTAKKINTYADSKDKPYIHLLDGGVADNLGIRGSLELIHARGLESFEEVGLGNTQKVVYVIVNAASKTEHNWGPLGKIPSLFGMLEATSTVMVNAVNYDTLYLMHHYWERWVRTYKMKHPSHPGIETYFVLVEFEGLTDEEQRRYFQGIPTTLSLPEKDVDALRKVAGQLLFESEVFQKLIRDLGGQLPILETSEN